MALQTVDTVIAAMEANHPDLTNHKTFKVEISCARERAQLVTDDKAVPKKGSKPSPASGSRGSRRSSRTGEGA